EVAALKQKVGLDEIAAKQHGRPNKRHLKLKDTIFIHDLHIKGNTDYPRDYIRGKLKIPTHAKVSFEQLNEGLNNLSATGNFESIHYKLIPKGAGKND